MIGNFEYTRPDLNLAQDVANIGDYSSIVSLFWVIDEFKFNSVNNFLDFAYWINGIAEKSIFPIHNIVNSESQNEDTSLNESKLRYRFFNHDGKYRFIFSINCDVEFYQKLRSYSGQNFKVYMIDINNNAYGKKVGASIEPFEVDFIQISKLKFGAASLLPYTDIIIDFTNANELDTAYISKIEFDPSELINIECSIENIVLDSSDTIIYNVFAPGDIPVNGLIVSDFTIVDDITGLKTNVTFTNSGNGEYTFESNENFYAGNIKLKNDTYNGYALYNFANLPQYNPSQYNNSQYST